MGKLVIFVGASGSGKTTILTKCGFIPVVSTTTRKPRAGEQEGVDYFFVGAEEFLKLKDEGGMPENACYAGNYYGISKKVLDEIKEADDATFYGLVADINGIKFMKNYLGDKNVLSIFVYTPIQDIVSRLSKRAPSSSCHDQEGAIKAQDALIQRLEHSIKTDEFRSMVRCVKSATRT